MWSPVFPPIPHFAIREIFMKWIPLLNPSMILHCPQDKIHISHQGPCLPLCFHLLLRFYSCSSSYRNTPATNHSFVPLQVSLSINPLSPFPPSEYPSLTFFYLSFIPLHSHTTMCLSPSCSLYYPIIFSTYFNY